MFFIMGVSQGQRKLKFDQLVICRSCGKYGHLEVYMVYSYLSLFFIPVLKWGRRYYVRTTCCGRSVPISDELGRRIAAGEVTSLPEDIIPEGSGYGSQAWEQSAGWQAETQAPGRPAGDLTDSRQTGPVRKRCRVCGFETEEDYQFCPRCGERL